MFSICFTDAPTWEVLKNPMFVSTPHALNGRKVTPEGCKVLDQNENTRKRSKFLPTYYWVAWERLELTQFHTISLEAFFTGTTVSCKLRHSIFISGFTIYIFALFGLFKRQIARNYIQITG